MVCATDARRTSIFHSIFINGESIAPLYTKVNGNPCIFVFFETNLQIIPIFPHLPVENYRFSPPGTKNDFDTVSPA